MKKLIILLMAIMFIGQGPIRSQDEILLIKLSTMFLQQKLPIIARLILQKELLIRML